MVRSTKLQRLLACALVLLTPLSLAAPWAFAASKSVEPLIAVVGHLALPGPPAVQMFAQEHGRQQYLLIAQASKEGMTVVNVTNPGNAAIVKQVAWPTRTSNTTVQLMNAGLLLSTASENSGPGQENPSTQTLNLLDVRDPANPQIIQSFTGVSATLLDESRELMYVANGEGLWILKYKHEQAAANPFGCPSEGTSTDPNCSY
jgi:hypothetical protein